MAEAGGGRRRVEVARPVLATSGVAGASAAHLEVARALSSPLLLGPPVCDELVALVCHLYTEDEAALVRHLGAFAGMTAASVAAAAGRPAGEVELVLARLADEVRSIAASGSGAGRTYRLLPVMPGMFEMVLIGQTPGQLTGWHSRFAVLFEALYETGYLRDYQEGRTRPAPVARALAVGRSIEAHPMALPSDRLEVVLDRYDVFGVAPCQCRMTARAAGKGCDRPLGNCAVMGEWAERGIAEGWLKSVSRSAILEVKREAESHGLVTWLMNVESSRGQISCSCCGCCCHALRVVSEFALPGYIAPAHFVPRFDDTRCIRCGRCARACPMRALEVDTKARTLAYHAERCVGCGLCAVACGDRRAVAMEPVPGYKLPYKSWYSYAFHTAVGHLTEAWHAWKSR